MAAFIQLVTQSTSVIKDDVQSPVGGDGKHPAYPAAMADLIDHAHANGEQADQLDRLVESIDFHGGRPFFCARATSITQPNDSASRVPE